MKQPFFSMFFLGDIALFSSMTCDKDRDVILAALDIPVVITYFVETYLPKTRIIQTVKEMDGGVVTYDVTLQGGVKLEFDKDKSIIEVDSNTELPQSFVATFVLPEIVRYSNANFPVLVMSDWDLEPTSYRIGLINDVDFIFDWNGNLLRIDY